MKKIEMINKKKKNDLERMLCSYRYVYIINDAILSKKLTQRTISKDVLILTNKDDLYEICLELYRLYEFTDKIFSLTDSQGYPMLDNLFSQGIITEDEFFNALLYMMR